MRPIDEKIIAMRLDNSDFETNARQSLSTMERIKSVFSRNKNNDINFDGAAKGASGLGKAVDDVSHRFSALKVAGVTALATITNHAVDAGLRFAKSFTIAPIMDGFNEYQLKMKSIQTIMANTKKDGTTLDQVTSRLDELNTYADKTIYNFAEMTRNIGSFTAAGIKLDPAVKSIKGIANLAALSGSNSQQASVAMYQLSQAIASGSLKLQDWNSVVNAGMGGATFQEALKRTARAHGIAVDQIIADQGSFRESLRKGWITADILTETLEQLTMSTEGVDKATIEAYKNQLRSQNYTEKQIDDILQLATTAEEAATKVRTFEQLFDAMGESIGSKWAQFWEYLVGDFGDATDRLSKIASEFDSFMGKTFDGFLDNMKKFTDMGGVKNLWKGMGNIYRNAKEVFSAIGKGLKTFLPKTTVEDIYKLSEVFVKLTEKARLPKGALDAITKVISTLGNAFSDVTSKVWDFTKNTAKAFSNMLSSINIGSIKDAISNISRELSSFVKGNALINNAFGRLKTTIGNIGNAVGPILEKIFGIKTAFASGGEDVAGFTKKYETLGERLKNINIWDAAVNGVKGFIEKIKELGHDFMSFLKGDMSFKDVLKNLFGDIKGPDLDIAGSIKNIKADVKGISEWARDAKASLQELFDWSDFKVFANLGLIAMEVAALKGIIGTIKALTEKTSLITPNLTKLADGWKTFTGAFKQNMKAKSMLSISAGLIAMAGAFFILSKIDPDRIGGVLVQSAAGLLMLVGTLKLLDKIQFSPKESLSLVASIVGVSAGILALSFALKKLSDVDIGKVGPVLVMVTATMGALKLMELSVTRNMVRGISKMAKLILSIAVSMAILGFALKQFDKISPEALLNSLGVFTALVAGMSALSVVSRGTNLTGMAGTVLAIAAAMMGLYLPLKLYGNLPFETLAKGTGTIAALGASIGLFVRLCSGASLSSAAGGLLAFAAAMVLLIIPIKKLGEMDLETLGQGLLGLISVMSAFALGVLALGAVASVLQGLQLSFIGFGKAVLLLTGSVALFGIGLLSAVTAIKMLSTLGPGMINGLETLITGLAIAIREAVPIIAEALVMMVMDSLRVLDENIEQFVDILARVLTKTFNKLAEHAEEITQSVINLVKAIGKVMAMAFSQLSVDDIFLAIVSVGAIAMVAKAVQGLGALMPGAMKGIALAGVLIAEVGLVLAAVGALRHIPGVAEAMDGGVDFLIDIGRAIGGFIGGIFGGAAEGATRGLPQLAQNLSDFATNIKPFMDMANQMPPDLSVKMDSISGALLKISGASFINSITSLIDVFSGGRSAEQFTSQLTALGRGLKEFANETAGLDVAAIDQCVQAVEKLVGLNNSLPSLNGLAQLFAGRKSFDDFGSGLVSLGKGLKDFSASVAGIDIAAIQSGVQAGEAIAKLQDSLPRINGLLQAFIGQGDLGSFGFNIAVFGKGLKRFSDSVVGIDIAAITAGVQAGEELSKLQGSLSNMGGLISLFTGDNDLGSFGKSIRSFGKSLKGFADSVTGIDISAIRSAVTVATDLNGLSLTNIQNLGEASKDIPVFGRRIKELGKDVSGFPADACRSAGSAVRAMATDITGLAKIDVGAITSLSNALEKVGKDAVNKIQQSFRNGQAPTAGVVRDFLNKLSNIIRSTGGSQMNTSGITIANKFVSGLRSRVGAVQSASRALANAARGGVSNINLYGFGVNAGAGFANGISSQYGRVYSAGVRLANAASSAVRRNLRIHSPSRVFYGLGDFSVAGFVNAFLDGLSSAKNAGKELVDATIEGVKNTAKSFSDMVNDEFSARPIITPVIDWDDVDPEPDFPNIGGPGQNGFNSFGSIDTALVRSVGTMTGAVTPTIPPVTKNYSIDNRGLLDGATFQVREEADIYKISREITRLQNEELYRRGVDI